MAGESSELIVSKYMTPLRFSTIEVGLYRGAYPTLRNFRFLRCLQIKMMISLTPEPPTADLSEYCQQFGIVNIHIPVAIYHLFVLPLMIHRFLGSILSILPSKPVLLRQSMSVLSLVLFSYRYHRSLLINKISQYSSIVWMVVASLVSLFFFFVAFKDTFQNILTLSSGGQWRERETGRDRER
jgi:hypothetical protein